MKQFQHQGQDNQIRGSEIMTHCHISPRKQATMEPKWLRDCMQNAVYQGRYTFLPLYRHVLTGLECGVNVATFIPPTGYCFGYPNHRFDRPQRKLLPSLLFSERRRMKPPPSRLFLSAINHQRCTQYYAHTISSREPKTKLFAQRNWSGRFLNTAGTLLGER